MATATQTQAPKADEPRKTPRVPPAVRGINVNFCKNPACHNFGIPVPEVSEKGPGAKNIYAVVANGAGIPAAKCHGCGETFTLKSNQGVFEEAYRLLSKHHMASSCPVESCANHRVPTSVPGAYHVHGTTKAGNTRYICRADKCGKTFTVKAKGVNPIGRQIHSDKNRMILSMLVGKMPLRRICEAADITFPVLHDRIDFFHEQAVAFLSDREKAIPDLELERLYVGVDRQENMINWTRRKNKRNVSLMSVAAADNATGYVFGMIPNFDPDMDPSVVEAEHKAQGDDRVGICHRKHARLWLQSDFDAASASSRRAGPTSGLVSEIETAYDVASSRPDVDVPEVMAASARKLPDRGMLVHAEYTMHGFFAMLAGMFKNVEKVRFFLDQDSGIRAACLAAFRERIEVGDCEAFYVRIAKEITVDEKRKTLKAAEEEFADVAAAHPGLKENDVKLLMLKDRIEKAREFGQWKDRWVFHPLPSLSEPEKAICHLTDFGQYDKDPDHLAWLYNKASLHAIDSFFNRLRRRSAMLERPMHSSGNAGRVYNLYGSYRPEQINKIQTIVRACHNFVWTGEGKKAPKGTPATRLGLAKAPLDLNDILYFR